MLIHTDKLARELEQARREWEELDPAHTSYEMRHRAEMRVLTLTRLLGVRAPELVRGATPPRTAAGWRRQALRAVRG